MSNLYRPGSESMSVMPSSKHEGTRTFRFRTHSHLGKASGAWTRMHGHFKKKSSEPALLDHAVLPVLVTRKANHSQGATASK